MSLRTRLLFAFAAVVLVPMLLLSWGLRREMSERLSVEYQRRLTAVVQVIDGDLRRESAAIADRLSSLRQALEVDNRFRLAAVAGVPSERRYLLDYAGRAMRLTGLTMLQIHDEVGRIVSSGHFRNEHGRIQPELPRTLADPPGAVVLATARSAEGVFLALVRGEPLTIGDRVFTLVGGMAVDESFVTRLAREGETTVTLVHPNGRVSPASASSTPAASDAETRALSLPLVMTTDWDAPGGDRTFELVEAQLLVSQPVTPLRTLRRSVDTWLLWTAGGAGGAALLLAVWISSRVSRPLAALADKTAVLDLDRLDVDFDAGRDEVGTLARLLGDLTTRLRASTTRVREAERRATVGDLARQVNHDIKNGLIPLRNVFRHLAQVGAHETGALPSVFAERRETIESSITYLETLASNYERLSRRPDQELCDVNDLVREVVQGARQHRDVVVDTTLAPDLPVVLGDRVSLRRIVDNVVANAVDSLDGQPGRVSIVTEAVEREGEPTAVRVTIADTGCGVTEEEAGRIFNDFYTTKHEGTGLGLSIVRRLVLDLQGTIRVESESGAGTTFVIEVPAGRPERET